MNNRIITLTSFSLLLISSFTSNAQDKNQSTTTTTKTVSKAKTSNLAVEDNQDKNLSTNNKIINKVKTPHAIVEDESASPSFSATDIIGNSSLNSELAIGFIDSFAIMGECEEGQKARREIESKRDLASQEIQEESKKLEKAKNDYISKSTTMSDAAREKEEKQLMKKDRELKALVAEKEEELKSDMQAATEKLAQSLEAGITELAQETELDVVFDKMTGRAIYVAPQFDFTSQAIETVNKAYEVKLAQNKQVEQSVKVANNNSTTTKTAKITT